MVASAAAENGKKQIADAQGQQAQAKRDPHAVQVRWFVGHKGKAVEVHLMTGRTITGILSAVDQYSCTIKQPDGRLALIFKHAIVAMEPGAGDDES